MSNPDQKSSNASGGTPKLALRQVSCIFGSTVAVDRLSLEIASGEFVTLLGPSGCGKTTTLRTIAGFIGPTEGAVEVDGRVISSPRACTPPERRQMSMIFQSYAIWPHMTVAENVAFGLTLRKLGRDEIQRKVRDILKVVRMEGLANRYPAELSGGQQQRVALARAIVIQPEILLLDEPLSNLDANLREEMRFEIRRLHDEFKITTVYVTHDQAEAMVISDRIAVMNQGRIEQVDAPYVLYGRPKTRFVAAFIGRTNFLAGNCHGEEIRFDHFAIRRDRFESGGQHFDGTVLFSVRPQSIVLHREPPVAPAGACLVEGQLVERAYLGESWEYVVAPVGSALRLRVTASPTEVFQVGERVWLALEPKQMVPIS
ncbi:MAG: ABC transporter ATP-binding protein [Candidatus Methylomirabilales bacterium]